MSTLSYNLEDRSHRRSKTEQHKKLMDEQYRYNFFREQQNNKSQFDRAPPSRYNVQRYSNPQVKLRLFIQQSNFLPMLAKKQNFTKMHLRRRSYDNDYYDHNNSITQDTQSQAIQYLNECEQIIQNLKRLTNMSTRKVQKIQQKYRSPIRQNRPSFQQFQSVNSRFQQIERHPSYYGSIQINSGRSQQKNNYLKLNSPNDRYRKAYEQPKSREIRNKHTQYSKQNSQFGQHQSRAHIKKIQEQLSFQENTSTFIQEKDIPKLSSQQKIKKTDNNNKLGGNSISQLSRIQPRTHLQQSQAYKQEEYFVKNNKDNQNKQQNEWNNQQDQQQKLRKQNERLLKQKAQQQQLQKAQKRQKYLLKFLNKAKNRGLELQKKIMEQKVKNNSSILKRKPNQQIQNKQSQDNNQQRDQSKEDQNLRQGKNEIRYQQQQDEKQQQQQQQQMGQISKQKRYEQKQQFKQN